MIALAAVAATRNVALIAVLLAVASAVGVCKSIMVVSLRQRVAPPGLFGRVFALVRLLVLVGVTPMVLLGGALAARVGSVTVLWLAAVLGVAVAVIAKAGGLSRDVR